MIYIRANFYLSELFLKKPKKQLLGVYFCYTPRPSHLTATYVLKRETKFFSPWVLSALGELVVTPCIFSQCVLQCFKAGQWEICSSFVLFVFCLLCIWFIPTEHGMLSKGLLLELLDIPCAQNTTTYKGRLSSKLLLKGSFLTLHVLLELLLLIWRGVY